jgi:hypothetical protein
VILKHTWLPYKEGYRCPRCLKFRKKVGPKLQEETCVELKIRPPVEPLKVYSNYGTSLSFHCDGRHCLEGGHYRDDEHHLITFSRDSIDHARKVSKLTKYV